MNAQLLAAAMGISVAQAMPWVEPIARAAIRAKLDNRERLAMFIAQIGHESASLSRLEESFNYTPQGLRATWPSRFTEELAQEVGRTKEKPADQKRIAQIAYGGRMGNAAAPSLDGWTYRGRGAIQITGRDNYARVGAALNLDLLRRPDLLLDPINGASAAAFYWMSNGLNKLADAKDVQGVTRVINGGLHGIADRVTRYNRAAQALGVE